MGLFGSDQDKATSDAARLQREANQRRELLERDFWDSHLGAAREAFTAGDTFFQVEIPHSAMRRARIGEVRAYAQTGGRPAGCDLLGGIQAEGWRRVQSAWDFKVAAEERGFFAPEGSVSVHGEMVGMHLFERDESLRTAVYADAPPAS